MEVKNRERLKRIHADISRELDGCFELSLTRIAEFVVEALAVIGGFCNGCGGSGRSWLGRPCEACDGRGEK